MGPTNLNKLETGVHDAAATADAAVAKPASPSSGDGLFWNGSAWVNSKISDASIAAGAAIQASKLASYPSSAAKYLAGDGSWPSLGAYISNYVPVLTASVTNPTMGSGANQMSRYTQVGKFVHYYGLIIFGGGGGAAAGSGLYQVSLPVTAVAAISDSFIGECQLADSSTSHYLPTANAALQASNGSYFLISYTDAYPVGSLLNVSNAAPWTWAANDGIRWNVFYEAA